MKEMIFNKVNKTVNKYNLISKDDTVLIGLSGGADSIFLALYLLSIKKDFNLTIKACHVEHGIRGEESLRDCKFVEDFCKKNSIEFFVKSINAPKEAKKAKMGVEEYSRKVRYDFFNSIECDKIATAHNLSDNVETVLFRLARGTSLKGVCGIPVKREKIIRPILEISGKEIREYLDENNISYCVDSTNLDTDYNRNKIRNQIIPLFEQINPDFINTVNRFIKISNEDEEYLSSVSKELYNKSFTDSKLDLDVLKNHSKSIIKRVIILYLKNFNIQTDEFHVNEILKLVFVPSKTQLNENLFLISDKKYLRVSILKDKIDYSNINVNKEIVDKDKFLNYRELSTDKIDFYCDCDKIFGNIIVRNRQVGDKITLAKRNCTKSLKKLFNELNIPVENRDNIPVLVDDYGIIGVYGYCVSNRVVVDDLTKKVMIIKIPTEDLN